MVKTIQMSIFDDIFQKTPEEVEKEKFMLKNQNQEGFWISICNKFIFINGEGEHEDYPHEAYVPTGYTVRSNRGRRSYYKQKKLFRTLKEAVIDAHRKISRQKSGSSYTIMAELKSNENAYEIRNNRTTGQSVFDIHKDNDGIKTRIQCFLPFKNYGRPISNEETKILREHNVLPKSWLKQPKKRMTVLSQLEEELKSKNNVNDILFISQMNVKMKENYLRTLIGFYDLLKKVFDVYSIAPVNIVVGDIRGNKNATYNPNTCTLSLHRHSLDSFFHEYRHHIEYRAGRKQYYLPTNPEEVLVQSLMKEEKLSKFVDTYKQIFKDFEEKEKPTSSDRYYYEKSYNYYYYYTSNSEINARFFEDYFLVNYKDELKKISNENNVYFSENLAFSEEEVKKYDYLVDELMSQLSKPVETLVANYKNQQ